MALQACGKSARFVGFHQPRDILVRVGEGAFQRFVDENALITSDDLGALKAKINLSGGIAPHDNELTIQDEHRHHRGVEHIVDQRAILLLAASEVGSVALAFHGIQDSSRQQPWIYAAFDEIVLGAFLNGLHANALIVQPCQNNDGDIRAVCSDARHRLNTLAVWER